MSDPLERASHAARTLFEEIRKLPVTGPAHLADVREHLAAKFSFEKPCDAETVVDDVASMLRRGIVQVTHPCYFGLFNPSVRPEAVAGAALVAAFNPQTAAWSHGEACFAMEQHALAWLAGRIGYDPAKTAAHFCSGGQEANTEAVIVALTNACPEVRERGLRAAASDPVLYVSAEGHHSFEKAAHLCGLGRAAVRRVAVDAKLRMDPKALATAIREDRAAKRLPFLVVGTAGTTSSGVIDPLVRIASICERERIWFHTDAAWGGGALLSSTLRAQLSGIERADSVTWDAHKWLQVPLGAGMFFTRHPAAAAAAFSTDAAYMPAARGAVADPCHTSHQWSRRAAGLPLFVTLATLGRTGYEQIVDRMTAMGELLRRKLTDEGFTVVNSTPLPLVNFTHPRIESGVMTTGHVARAVARGGLAWISPTVIAPGTRHERNVLRACITSYRTEERDLDTLVFALRLAVAADV